MKEIIGAVTVILAFAGLIPYILDILRNRTKPHVFTWVVWALVTFLAFLAQWKSGGGAGSWTTGITGLLTIFIAVLALKKGSKDITNSDVVIFIGALIAIIPWLLTKDPTVSVILLTIINSSAYIPTVRKTINDPSSETLSSYILHAVRHSLSILALSNYTIPTFLYPLINASMNATVATIIIKSRSRLKTPNGELRSRAV